MTIFKNLETVIGFLDKLLSTIPAEDSDRKNFEMAVNTAIRCLRYVQKLQVMNKLQKSQKPKDSTS